MGCAPVRADRTIFNRFRRVVVLSDPAGRSVDCDVCRGLSAVVCLCTDVLAWFGIRGDVGVRHRLRLKGLAWVVDAGMGRKAGWADSGNAAADGTELFRPIRSLGCGDCGVYADSLQGVHDNGGLVRDELPDICDCIGTVEECAVLSGGGHHWVDL